MKDMGGEYVTIITCCGEHEPLPLIQSLMMTGQQPDHIVVVDYNGNDHRRKRISQHFDGWTYAMPAESFNLARGETLGGRLAPPKGWWCFVNPRLMFPPGWFVNAGRWLTSDDAKYRHARAACVVSEEEPKDAADLRRISQTSPAAHKPAGLLIVSADDAMRVGAFDDEANDADRASGSMGHDWPNRAWSLFRDNANATHLGPSCIIPWPWEVNSLYPDRVLHFKALIRAAGHDLQYPPFDRAAIGPCNRVWSSDTTVPLPSENAQW